MKWLRRTAMWLVWNVPLGCLAPHVMGFALGAKRRIKLDNADAKFIGVEKKHDSR